MRSWTEKVPADTLSVWRAFEAVAPGKETVVGELTETFPAEISICTAVAVPSTMTGDLTEIFWFSSVTSKYGMPRIGSKASLDKVEFPAKSAEPTVTHEVPFHFTTLERYEGDDNPP